MNPACPKCGSTHVHRSHRRNITERLAGLVGAKMKRCHECNFRFVQLYGSTLLWSDFRRVLYKVAWAGVIMAALVIVLAVVLWFSSRQASFSPGEGGAMWVLGAQPGKARLMQKRAAPRRLRGDRITAKMTKRTQFNHRCGRRLSRSMG